ncbi:hypothetical protein BSL78_25129 [Apostichopus japonicus]|uniref:Uncharacterized protein n=1 Tax=Stichopus japonicus TaxID=307972 RepID=A0A2G8JQP8_STIJA|nr:hypothetical protein BSL78_25129 [Apostichopus japonicus]
MMQPGLKPVILRSQVHCFSHFDRNALQRLLSLVTFYCSLFHSIGGLEVEEDDSDSIQVVSVQRGSQMSPEFVAQDNSMQESRIEGVTGVDRWMKQEEEDDPGEEDVNLKLYIFIMDKLILGFILGALFLILI